MEYDEVLCKELQSLGVKLTTKTTRVGVNKLRIQVSGTPEHGFTFWSDRAKEPADAAFVLAGRAAQTGEFERGAEYLLCVTNKDGNAAAWARPGHSDHAWRQSLAVLLHRRNFQGALPEIHDFLKAALHTVPTKFIVVRNFPKVKTPRAR